MITIAIRSLTIISSPDTERMTSYTTTRDTKETLVIALFAILIVRLQKIGPNSIKAILNKAGLDQSTSMSSRA